MEALGPGKLLIAEPFLKDPNFMRTVVLLCEHQTEGSFGFVLNRDFNRTIDELVPDLEGIKLPVHYGGPVQMDTLHFLHQYPDKIPGSYQVTEGVYWGGDFEIAIGLLRNKEIDINKIRFYIGYSGWSGGQLDDEMKEKSWLTTDASRKLIFHRRIDEIWKDSLRQLGGEYEMMINFPTDPQLN
ncbi:MAG: YqgE/AlgH family protein [Chitinophagaceae bacterium]|nr:YqgE/AlgH family protein [Chitinophagaceae bacterium]